MERTARPRRERRERRGRRGPRGARSPRPVVAASLVLTLGLGLSGLTLDAVVGGRWTVAVTGVRDAAARSVDTARTAAGAARTTTTRTTATRTGTGRAAPGRADTATATRTAGAAGTVRGRRAALAYDRRARRWDARDLAEATPGSTRWQTVRIDGVVRRYLLSVPAGVTGRAPLVVAFHGLGEQAAAFAAQTGLVAATRAAGEVLVLPESEGPAFNDGRLGPGGPADDTFALTVIRRLVAAGRVDPERVTVAGFSNGAGMAMQLADTHPETVAAVVSIDGSMIAALGAPRPTGPVEAVLLHGTADRIQPWDGRHARGITWPSYVPVLATVHAWVRADHAGLPVRSTVRSALRSGPAAADSSPGPVGVTRWAPGPSGAGVTFYEVHGMGHRWPVSARPALRSSNDALEGVSATAVVVATAATAGREGTRTVRV